MFYNEITVAATWIRYCNMMDITCANFRQLTCNHNDLMNNTNSCNGYTTFKNILISEMKVIAKVQDQVADTADTNELNEALTSTWTLMSASFIFITG